MMIAMMEFELHVSKVTRNRRDESMCRYCNDDPMCEDEVTNVRYQVRWFAEQMELKLKENDHKGGWDICGLFWLLKRLEEEAVELREQLLYNHNNGIKHKYEEVIKECADVANFSMMIADIAKKRMEEAE